MKKPIKKAVFPVAGLGSRFLPATKVSPKEMLPIVDKPLIQFAVEEAIEAGAEVMIFITGRTKGVIADHFDKAYELETELANRQKTALLEVARSVIPAHISCVYIRQAEPLGLGHAVLCARPVVGDEAFAVILPDDLIDGAPGCMRQMADLHTAQGCSVLGVERIAPEDTQSYGIVKTGASLRARVSPIEQIVEKPRPDQAPSNLAVVGRYILTPEIFNRLERTGRGAGGEIQLTDGIAQLLERETVLAYEFSGTRYDCGAKLGYLAATVDYGLKHPELGAAFRAHLRNLSI